MGDGMHTLVGKQLGAYRIEQELGAGGMGTVFAGRHADTEQLVAIKIMRGDHTRFPSFEQRFLREAQAIARLDHPHIVKLLYFEKQGEYPYLVMELIKGGNLRSLLQKYASVGRTMPLTMALGLIQQAAQALAYAHKQGVIHRDIKPDNMLLQRIGDPANGPPRFTLKLTDFGLARLVQSTGLTSMSGAVMGTPHYMAPEQCLGQPVDQRADIYALGVVLYEIATGYLPFQASNREDVMAKHVNETPRPPRSVNPELSPVVEQLIMRCLAKKPDDRYQTAEELVQAIDQVLRSSAVPPHYSIVQTPVNPQLASTEIETPIQPSTNPQLAPTELPAAVLPANQTPAILDPTGGRQVGPYLIETALPFGAGGMGEVFRARDQRDGRLVALKLLYPNLASDPKVRQRFHRREAQIAGMLHHPNIVAVYEAGEDGNQLFLAMELVGGGSLRGLLERRSTNPWPLALGLALTRQATLGLAYAHEQGVVHRDIKPDNMLLRKLDRSSTPGTTIPPVAPTDDFLSGLLGMTAVSAPRPAAAPVEQYELKLSDFGIATLTDGTRLTSTGNQLGTHAYMSPEQITGKSVDARTDIYALGVVLYEIATGRLPYVIDNPSAAIYQILFTSPPPPRSLNPALPVAIEQIILRCLAREPQDRYQSANELADALQQALDGLGAESTQVAPAQATSMIRGSDDILISLSQSTLAITPGIPTSMTVTIRNLGRLVDHYSLRIEGVPDAWLTIDPPQVQINPSDAGTMTLTINVPRAPESRAGEYELTIYAEAQHARKGEFGIAQARWTVVEYMGNALAVQPRIAQGRDQATYTLQLRNDGNAAARYSLRGEDDLSALRYRFTHAGQAGQAGIDAASIALEPGGSADVSMQASTARRLIGNPTNHTISLTLVGGSEPKMERLQFVQRPLIPPALLGLLTFLLLATCGGIGWLANQVLIVQPNNATATAEARATNEQLAILGTATRGTEVAGIDATSTAQRNAAQQTATAQQLNALATQGTADILAQQTVQVFQTAGAEQQTAQTVAQQTSQAQLGIQATSQANIQLTAVAAQQGLAAAQTAQVEQQTAQAVAPQTSQVAAAQTAQAAEIAAQQTAQAAMTQTALAVPTNTPTSTPTPTSTALPIGYAMADFIGNWSNIDSATSGTTRIVITQRDANNLKIDGYGKCHPTDCDWTNSVGGVSPIAPFTPPVLQATYTFSFKVTKIVIERSGELLKITTFDHYTDTSGRADRTDTFMMKR